MYDAWYEKQEIKGAPPYLQIVCKHTILYGLVGTDLKACSTVPVIGVSTNKEDYL